MILYQFFIWSLWLCPPVVQDGSPRGPQWPHLCQVTHSEITTLPFYFPPAPAPAFQGREGSGFQVSFASGLSLHIITLFLTFQFFLSLVLSSPSSDDGHSLSGFSSPLGPEGHSWRRAWHTGIFILCLHLDHATGGPACMDASHSPRELAEATHVWVPPRCAGTVVQACTEQRRDPGDSHWSLRQGQRGEFPF